MSDPYLDRLPSQEREKIKKRLRSPWEYEKLRENVKGPEDLEREMEKNAEFAEAKLALETEPKAQEKAKEKIRDFASEKSLDAAFEHSSEGLSEALKKGTFEVTVDAKSREPKLAVKINNQPKGSSAAPSGNVAEVFSLKPALQQQILSALRSM